MAIRKSITMLKAGKRTVFLALCLSFLAGFLDALGFISLGGVFVSFMSGNSTRSAVGLVQEGLAGLIVPGGIILCFVLGVISGTLLGNTVPEKRVQRVLTMVSIALILAASIHNISGLAAAIIAFAMGASNTAFQRNGEVSIGVTYMTGTLVKMGQHIANALSGGPQYTWFRYFLLWASLVLGACSGALIYGWVGLAGIWVAALISVFLTGITIKLNM